MFSTWLRKLVNRKPQPLTGGRRSRRRSFGLQLETLEDRTVPTTLLALNATGNTLLRFDSATPGVLAPILPITGLLGGESVQAIDFRPATGQLFGLGVNGATARLLTLDLATGAATAVGTLSQPVAGTDFGFDFNPTNDRIRVTSDADINYLVNPNDAVVTVQGALNPGTPNIVGSAYTNNFPTATVTTLFGIDSGTDQLFVQVPATGALSLIGSLGVDTDGSVGFDIVNNTTAFASLTVGGNSNLYLISTGTGAATLVGQISPAAITVRGLTVMRFSWDGGGADDNWTTAANWAGDVAPAAGDDLVFPAGAARTATSNNDFANGTIFNSITFTGSGYDIDGNDMTLSAGMLDSAVAGNNDIDLNITLGGTQIWSVSSAGETLFVGGAIGGGAGASLNKERVAATTLNAGTLQFEGVAPNTYLGTTSVNGGTLQLNKTGGAIALAGPLVIGDGTGGALSDFVQELASDSIANTANVTINSSGLFGFNLGISDTINNLSMTGGAIDTSTGVLTVSGTIIANSDAAGLAATIDGNLTSVTGSFIVNNAGAGITDLDVTAVIAGGAGLTKSGAGTMTLSGTSSNTYTGLTTVTDGTLELNRSGGTAVTGDLTVGDGVGATLTAIVTLVSSDQIPDGALVVILSDGLLAFNAGVTETISTLNMTGGAVDSSTGTLTVQLLVIATGDATGLGATIDGNIIVNTGTFNVGDEPLAINDLEVNAVIGGTAGLIKNGTGRMVISGANTYTGATIVSDGKLTLGIINGVPTTSDLTVLSPAVLELNGFDQTLPSLTGNGFVDNQSATTATLTIINVVIDVFDGQIQGNINLVKDGAGTLTLTNTNTYTGTTTVSAGTLANNIVNALPTTTMLTVNAPGTYDLAGFSQTVAGFDGNGVITNSSVTAATLTTVNAVDKDFSGTLTGNLALTKAGTATQTLSGAAANTYTGVTTINEGTLNLNKTGATAVPGNIVIGDDVGGPFADVLQVSQDEQIADTSAITINSSGLLLLVPPTTAETIASLNMLGGAVDTTTAALTVNGPITATSDATGLSASIAGSLVLGTGGGTFTVNDGPGLIDLDVFADISGTPTLTKAGTGLMVIYGANTYAGGTVVNNGTLANGVVNGVPLDSTLTVNAPGIFDLAGFDQQVSAILGNGTITNSSASLATLTVNNAVGDTFPGLLTGNLALTKIGAGILTLTANNLYTGVTTVNAGQLIVNGTQPSSAITVNAGGTVGGSGVTGAITTNGGTVSPGQPSGAGSLPGVLTTNGNVFNPGTFLVNINGTTAGTQYDVLNVQGSVTITNGTLTLVYGVGTSTPVGATFNLINNDGNDPITGTFTGFPEGFIFTLNNGTVDQRFQISYVGGDGNDLVLTRVNTAPVVTAPANQTADEGTPKAFNLGSFFDPDPNTPWTVTVNWGDGTANDVFTVNAIGSLGTRTHTFADNVGSPFTVTVRVDDPNGGTDQKTFQVVVSNVAPANLVLNSLPNPSNENQVITLTGTFTDPGTLDTHTVLINWNDGTTDTINLGAGVLNFSIQHRYLDNKPGNAPFVINVTVTDKDGASTSATRNQVVNNVAPVITEITPNAVQITEGQTIQLRVSFVDPGTQDTFTVVVDWTDGTQDTIQVQVGQFVADPNTGLRQLTVNHRYGIASFGKYAIGVRVTDKDGARDQKAFGDGSLGGAGVLVNDLITTTSVTIVGQPDPITGKVSVGVPTPATLFTFTDAGDIGAVSDYDLTVDWGDGTVDRVGSTARDPFNPGFSAPALVIGAPSGNTYTVTGTHIYSLPQQFTITLRIRDLRSRVSPAGTLQRDVAGQAPTNRNPFFVAISILQVPGASGGNTLLGQIFLDTSPALIKNGVRVPLGIGQPEPNVFRNIINGNGLKFDPSIGLPQAQLDQLRANTVQLVMGSREFLTRIVRSFYLEILNRDPVADANGLVRTVRRPTAQNPQNEDVLFLSDPSAQGWVQFLAQTGSISQFRLLLLSSPEYTNRFSRAEYVNQLYCQLLGRTTTGDPGSQFWINQLNAGVNPLQVALSIFNSAEGTAFTVQRLFLQYLGRGNADPLFINFLRRGGTENQVLLAILASPEYASRASSAFRIA